MKVDYALRHAARGFAVFPLKPDSKLPAFRDWQGWATTDPRKIRRHWESNPDHNIGIYTHYLLALDVDNKNGKQGDHSLLKLELEGRASPATFTQTTPTGGRHYVFRAPHPVSSSAGKIGTGLDIRGSGGYVVAAGSTIDGKPYTCNDAPLADAPAWLLERCQRPREKPATPAAAVPEGINHKAATERVRHYLTCDALLAVEGQGGDHSTFAVAARCKDLGTPEADTLALMLEHWNPRCSPPWSPDDLAKKVANAYRYGTEAPGVAAADGVFDAVKSDAVPAQPKVKKRLQLLTDQPGKRPRPFDLVKRTLRRGELSIWPGAPDAGKTALLSDLLCHIGHGIPWFGRKTSRSPVFSVAAERAHYVQGRLDAFHKGHPECDRSQLLFTYADTEGLMLDTPEAEDILCAACDEIKETTGMPVALVVIDTLAAAFSGDENSAQDIGKLIKTLKGVARRTGAHVAVAHHVGKDPGKGGRGSSRLLGDFDAEFIVADGLLKITKLKGGDKKPISFDIQSVEIGRDEEGDPLTSTLIVPSHTSRAFTLRPVKPGSVPAKALATIEDLARSKPGAAIPASDWQAEFAKCHYAKSPRKTASRAFDRARDALLSAGRISIENGHVVVHE